MPGSSPRNDERCCAFVEGLKARDVTAWGEAPGDESQTNLRALKVAEHGGAAFWVGLSGLGRIFAVLPGPPLVGLARPRLSPDRLSAPARRLGPSCSKARFRTQVRKRSTRVPDQTSARSFCPKPLPW